MIAEHFHQALYDEEARDIPDIQPAKMTTPFDSTEVEKAIKSLRNNRSPGIDEIKAEQLKNGKTAKLTVEGWQGQETRTTWYLYEKIIIICFFFIT